jgi:glycosyltransferase involved in cell wall biosynthesis
MLKIPPQNVSIIMPIDSTHSENIIMTREALNSLQAGEPEMAFEIILIDSSHRSVRYVGARTYQGPSGKFNYHRAINMGLQYARADWVVLCNNDLLFEPGWMSAILAAHTKRPDIWSFSPWLPNSEWPDAAAELLEGYRVRQEVMGWCIACKREVFNHITLLEHVAFWFSDTVYADLLQLKGIKHAVVRDSLVTHLESRTLRTLEEQIQRELTTGQEKPYADARGMK